MRLGGYNTSSSEMDRMEKQAMAMKLKEKWAESSSFFFNWTIIRISSCGLVTKDSDFLGPE